LASGDSGFKIAGNLYYVGTADLAAYLVVTPQGNILINGNFKEDVPAIRKSIEGLGFKYADTKALLISHAHGDHDEGIGLIKSETGARLMVMDADVAAVESTAPGRPGAKVDRVLHDRDTVELGDSKLTARLTPGHTPGCTTWTMQVSDGGRMLNAVIVGSPNVNAGYVLVNNKTYPGIAADYVKTFAVLKATPVDLFLGAHGAYFNLKDKLPKLGGATNPFIDPAGYRAYVAEREQAFEKELTKQRSEARTGDAVGFDIEWNHVAISVPNIAETMAWYEKMLGFKGTVRPGQPGGPSAGRGSAPWQRHDRAVPAGGRRPAAGVEKEPLRGLPHARREALRLRGEEPAGRARGIEGQRREDGLRSARHPDRRLRVHQRQRRQRHRAHRAQDAIAIPSARTRSSSPAGSGRSSS
jgi:metallo-beta-lactamase class B